MKKLLIIAIPLFLTLGCGAKEDQPAVQDQGAASPEAKANPPSDLMKQKIRDFKDKKKGG